MAENPICLECGKIPTHHKCKGYGCAMRPICCGNRGNDDLNKLYCIVCDQKENILDNEREQMIPNNASIDGETSTVPDSVFISRSIALSVPNEDKLSVAEDNEKNNDMNGINSNVSTTTTIAGIVNNSRKTDSTDIEFKEKLVETCAVTDWTLPNRFNEKLGVNTEISVLLKFLSPLNLIREKYMNEYRLKRCHMIVKGVTCAKEKNEKVIKLSVEFKTKEEDPLYPKDGGIYTVRYSN